MPSTWDPPRRIGALVSCEPDPHREASLGGAPGVAAELAKGLDALLVVGSRTRTTQQRAAWQRAVLYEARRVARGAGGCLHLAICDTAWRCGDEIAVLYGGLGPHERELAAWLLSGLQGCGVPVVTRRVDGCTVVPWLRPRLACARYAALELYLPARALAEARHRGIPLVALLASWTLAVTAGWAPAPLVEPVRGAPPAGAQASVAAAATRAPPATAEGSAGP